MYFILDLVCVAMIAIAVIHYWSHPVSHVLLKCVCAAVALSVAAVAGAPLTDLMCERFTDAYVQEEATLELGEILTGIREEHAEDVRFDGVQELLQNETESFQAWLARYGATVETAHTGYSQGLDGTNMVRAVTKEYSFRITRATVYVALWIVTFLLSLLIIKRIEWNLTEAPPRRGIRRLGPPLCGALYGLLLVMGLSLFLEWIIPAVSGDSMIWSNEMLTRGTVYPLLRQIHPFIYLYF